MMLFSQYLWLLLCYAQYARGDLMEYYEEIRSCLSTSEEKPEYVPVELEKDEVSGCICRASKNGKMVVCFGNYTCKKFPKITFKSETVRVRMSLISEILKGELDSLYYLKNLEIEANHKLQYLESGLFKNMSELEKLSISYNTGLRSIEIGTFAGLINLKILNLVNNGFSNILDLTPELGPNILPSLKALDLSGNAFKIFSANAFSLLNGTPLRSIKINLCQLDFIHPNSFLPLKFLEELHIGENDLNSTIVSNLVLKLKEEGIHLSHLDLSGMGYRKHPPIKLMNIISKTSIKSLNLANNHFEVISDNSFPVMDNIEILDLRRVFATAVTPNAFSPRKFPNLKTLLLGGNNLPGIHNSHLSNHLSLLDLSYNKGRVSYPLYFEIGTDTFTQNRELRILNLACNRIKAVFNYTFKGLEKLKILNIENGTIYHIGNNTFKTTRHLELLNLANNPLTANKNLSKWQFIGLNELKILILRNCGIKHLLDDDNIFEMMPNLTHLILTNNQLYYITPETMKPLKFLQVLDLSGNLLMSWWNPLFLTSGIRPKYLNLMNNKISYFTSSMIQDINYLLLSTNNSVDINFMDNVFVCECNVMYSAYLWLEVYGSDRLKKYFDLSEFQCRSPNFWENKKVSEYLTLLKNFKCVLYDKFSIVIILIWMTPSIIIIVLLILFIIVIYKNRIYIRYWLFLAKLALGRRFMRNTLKKEQLIETVYRYDAFVSYCNNDSGFVLKMVDELETNPPYLKLCVYERDFEVGSFISESILSSIKESRYVILIISNSFAKSHWCLWEAQLAEYHRLFLEDEISYDPLILIKLGEVNKKYLTITLKFLLKTKIYLCWDESRPHEFWNKLRSVLIKKK